MKRFVPYACLALLALLVADGGGEARAAGETWVATGSLADGPRTLAASVRLADGRVFVAGGYAADGSTPRTSAEVYDPDTGTWSLVGTMTYGRIAPTASLLPDGRVLVAGGSSGGGATTELWTEDAGFSAGPSMLVARAHHTATTLADGRILVTGGLVGFPNATNSAEVYTPVTGGSGSWASTGSMGQIRQNHTAALLADGTVLVVGGDQAGANGFAGTTTCERFDPAGAGSFSSAAALGHARTQAAMARLADGRILLVGGGPNTHAAEILDPGAASPAWVSAGTTASGGIHPTLTALEDGRAVAAGGSDATGVLDRTDLFHPQTGWAALPDLSSPRYSHTADLLGGCEILVTGGYASSAPVIRATCDRLTCVASNQPPVAVAGPDQSIHAGDLVVLDGSASYDDNTASASLGYAWTFASRPAGSTATLSTPTAATTSFTADKAGIYVVSLVVVDTDATPLPSAPDEVTISSTNLAPSASAGPDRVGVVDVAVSIAGSASDPEGDALTYQWTIASAPAGSTATLSGATTLTPGLTPDAVGVYVLSLVASDAYDDSSPSTMSLTVISGTDFAEGKVTQVSTLVQGLPATSLDSNGHRTALAAQLGQVVNDLQAGRTAHAQKKLRDLIERMDGCTLRGAVDGAGPSRDWIVDCDAQVAAYDLLVAALGALAP